MGRKGKDGMPVREEREEFRLRPSRRKAPRQPQPHAVVQSFARLVRAVAAGTSRRSRSTSPANPTQAASRQRCAVRLTYSVNRIAGHFAAHGRYLLRDKATGTGIPYGSFGETPLIDALGDWQKAGDRRLFKVILSPEFGDRIDLNELSKEFVSRIERDLATKLQWAAVNHFNTDHPHIHLVIRGVDSAGNEVRFPAPYIKESLRAHAAAICTEQLGHRTLADVHHARRGEVSLHRFTSLDRILLKRAEVCPEDAALLRIQIPTTGQAFVSFSQTNELLASRLRFLTAAGIGRQEHATSWLIPMETESILRGMQTVADRQRMLARTGVATSDDRLPHRITQLRDITELRGRVLGHVDNEVSDRVYMVLEGTDGIVHFLPHAATLETHRAHGDLKPNHFVSLNQGPEGLGVHDHGDADSLLKRTPMLALPSEVVAATQGWRGWLGSFHARLNIPAPPISSPALEPAVELASDSVLERTDFER